MRVDARSANALDLLGGLVEWPLHQASPVLHRTLPGIAALGLLVLGGGCSSSDTSGGDCAVTPEQKTITTTEPAVDPGIQFKIDSCRADVDACPTLCALAMTRAGISFNNGGALSGGGDVALPPSPGGFTSTPVNPTVACDVTFDNGTVAMVVKYDVYESTLGCPVQVTNTTDVPSPAPGGAI